jgi:RNA polymerase Rpb3/RpoA insert domain/RNA polymerase Rpb3/Rpb11 dimerisation domain
MNNFIVSCLESRVEEDGKLYGKFFIGPCNPGQGTTLGTALRRNLLSETSGIGIVAVQIKGAEHEYCSLPGVRESVLDIILNLKMLALVGDIKPEEPCIGFLDVSGPVDVKASHIRFPLGISPVKLDHHIGTVSYDGNLSLKIFLMRGKNFMIHNSSTIPQVESLNLLSPLSVETKSFYLFSKKIRDLNQNRRYNFRRSFGSESNLFPEDPTTQKAYEKDLLLESTVPSSQGENENEKVLKTEKGNDLVKFTRDQKISSSLQLFHSPFSKQLKLSKANLQLQLFWKKCSDPERDPFFVNKQENSLYFDAFLELLKKDSPEYKLWENDENNLRKNFLLPIEMEWPKTESFLLLHFRKKY